jgi:hypothetical protein
MAPRLSPRPGRTARFYRRNRRSRRKHIRDNTRINNTPQKREYRAKLQRARRRRKPGPQTDMSHKGGRLVAENRKANRARGGAVEARRRRIGARRRMRSKARQSAPTPRNRFYRRGGGNTSNRQNRMMRRRRPMRRRIMRRAYRRR